MAWRLLPELALVLLAVRGDVALQLHLKCHRTRAEDALVHLALVLGGCARAAAGPSRCGSPSCRRCSDALSSDYWLTARWSWMEDLGVEHLLAEGAAEEDEGVHVQQVFLQVSPPT